MLDEPTPVEAPADEPNLPSGEEQADTPSPSEPVEESSAPPWGEDFDPDRAWRTIQTQREENKQLKQIASQVERLKSDPQALNEFLTELGYELADDEDDDPTENDDTEDDEYLDPVEKRIAQLEQIEAERREQAEMDRLVTGVEKQFTSIGEEFTDEQKQFLVNDSRRFPLTPEGLPDVKAAYEAFQKEVEQRVEARLKGWKDTKKGTVVQTAGTSATQVPNLDDAQQRQAWMAAQIAARSRDD